MIKEWVSLCLGEVICVFGKKVSVFYELGCLLEFLNLN